MERMRARLAQRHRPFLWLVWLLCLGLWTLALLTSYPVQVKDAVLSPEAGYHASKLLHVCAYALLTGFAAWLVPGGLPRFLPILFLSLHAFATEYLQQFVALRTGSLTDVGFNHVGITLGLIVTWWKWRQVISAPDTCRRSGPAAIGPATTPPRFRRAEHMPAGASTGRSLPSSGGWDKGVSPPETCPPPAGR